MININNGSQTAATLRRGREPVRGNGPAGRVAYITVNDVLHHTGVSSTRQRRVARSAIECGQTLF